MTRRAVVAALTGAALALIPVRLHGQARSIMTPSVSFGAAYDDNILGTPDDRISDNIYRLTPGFAITRDTVRVNWIGDFSMDSEWFAHRQEFNTPAARQHAASRVRWQVLPVAYLTFVGGYDNSVNPAELNLTTGLTPGRTRAWRAFGETEGEYHVTPVIKLLARYRTTGEYAQMSNDLLAQLGEFQVVQSITERDDLRARYTLEYFAFEREDNVLSNTATFGWQRRLSSSSKFNLDGGFRHAAGSWTPEIQAEVSRDTSVFDVAASYGWTRTSALGVSGLVDVQRGTVTLRYDYPKAVSASLTGGIFMNRADNRRADVYLVSADVVRHLFGAVSIAIGGTLDQQRGRIVSAPIPASIPVDPLAFVGQAALTPVTLNNNVRRATVAVRLVISGSMKSASGPGLPQTDPSRNALSRSRYEP